LSIQDFLKQKLARKSLFDFGIFYGSFFLKKTYRNHFRDTYKNDNKKRVNK